MTSSLTFFVSIMTRKRNTDLNRKEPVRLRQRRIKNGGYSLYLDTYWNGKRSYDFLKLYLNPPTDDLAIIENKTTLELAKQIKYKRILELQTGLHGSAVGKWIQFLSLTTKYLRWCICFCQPNAQENSIKEIVRQPFQTRCTQFLPFLDVRSVSPKFY